MSKSNRVALIDGDTLIYAASAGNEYEAQWEPWLWTLHANFDAAMEQVHQMVEDIQKGVNADSIVMALTDDTNFRKEVMPSYKSNRVAKRKPIVYKPLREYCHEQWPTFQRPTLEGDDVLGILATHPTLVKGEKVVVSIDKDMKTIPGLHSNYTKDNVSENWLIHQIKPAVADFWHMYQTLTGDTSDGYPGCPKIGPVTALKVLGVEEGQDLTTFSVSEAWPKIVAAYAKQGLGEEVALQNARVARICRAGDYDFKEKRVRLWQPK